MPTNSQRIQYIEEYESVLLKLKEAQELAYDTEESEVSEPIELRRTLSELVAAARRTLNDKESFLFKIACEEIEDCILIN